MFWRSRKPPPLKSLEEKARTWGRTPEQLRRDLLALGLTADEIEAAFSPEAWRRIGESSLDRVIRGLGQLTGPSAAERLRSEIAVEVVNTADINCGADPTTAGDAAHGIRVHAGFIFFVNKIAHVCAGEVLRVFDFPSPRGLASGRALLGAVYGGNGLEDAWSVEHGALAGDEIEVKSTIFRHVMDAAMAHEVAHVLEFRSDSPWQEEKRRILESAVPFWARRAHRRKIRRESEFRADTTASSILPPAPAPWEIGGPDGLLLLLDIVGMIERRIGVGERGTATHPPAHERRRRLAEKLAGRGPEHLLLRRCSELCRAIQP